MRPLDCFPALAMTGGELARMMRVMGGRGAQKGKDDCLPQPLSTIAATATHNRAEKGWRRVTKV